MDFADVSRAYRFHSGATVPIAILKSTQVAQAASGVTKSRRASLSGVRPSQCVVVPLPGPVGISRWRSETDGKPRWGEVASVEALQRDQV
jgi:hypothetical protein